VLCTVAWDNGSAAHDTYPSGFNAWLEGPSTFYGQALLYCQLTGGVPGTLRVQFLVAQQGAVFNGLTAVVRYFVLTQPAL
jgi:hypothetical protein